MPDRLACIFVPYFPLAAQLRGRPDLTRQPLAVLEGKGHAARVLAATPAAAKSGIKNGLSVPQARALLPALITHPRHPKEEKSAQAAMIHAAESFSPRVEEAGEGLLFIDLMNEQDERALAQALLRKMDRLNLPAQVGIAGNKLTARVAAECPESPVIVPIEGEAEFLAPLSLTHLRPPAPLLETFEQWGLRSMGDLAHLSEPDIISRLGREGWDLHRQSRGLDDHPLIPRQPPAIFSDDEESEWPLLQLEPFLLMAEPVVERLARRLAAFGLACRKLDFKLKLEPYGFEARTLPLAAPTRDLKTLMGLLQLELSARPPREPIVGLEISMEPETPRQVQLSLFGAPAISPDKLATTIARVSALVGPERIGSPQPVDGYRPERFSLGRYDPPPPDEPSAEKGGAAAFTAVRVLRLPVELNVIVDQGLRPVSIRSASDIAGPVRVASGPWKMEEAWWSSTQATRRDYWDIELADGALYRIYREEKSGAWWADGIYD